MFCAFFVIATTKMNHWLSNTCTLLSLWLWSANWISGLIYMSKSAPPAFLYRRFQAHEGSLLLIACLVWNSHTYISDVSSSNGNGWGGWECNSVAFRPFIISQCLVSSVRDSVMQSSQLAGVISYQESWKRPRLVVVEDECGRWAGGDLTLTLHLITSPHPSIPNSAQNWKFSWWT